MASDNELSEAEARYKLRETFLQSIVKLKGKHCEVLTHEQSNLKATFSEWKPDGSEIIVTDLITPAKVKMESALLRSTDVIAIRFNVR